VTETVKRACRATAYGKDPSILEVTLVEFDRATRARRAAKISLPLLAGAIESVPVPGWHFVGVPGLLGASIVMGRRRWRQRARIESLAGDCPACGVPIAQEPPAELGSADVELARMRCEPCGEFLKLELV